MDDARIFDFFFFFFLFYLFIWLCDVFVHKQCVWAWCLLYISASMLLMLMLLLREHDTTLYIWNRIKLIDASDTRTHNQEEPFRYVHKTKHWLLPWPCHKCHFQASKLTSYFYSESIGSCISLYNQLMHIKHCTNITKSIIRDLFFFFYGASQFFVCVECGAHFSISGFGFV